MLFVGSIIIWLLASYIADTGVLFDPTSAARLVYATAAFLPLFLSLFIINFLRQSEGNNQEKKYSIYLLALTLVAGAMAVLSVTSYSVKDASLGRFGVEVTKPGPLLGIHVFYYFIVTLIAYVALVRRYRKTVDHEKKRIRLLIGGLTFMILVNIVVNGILILFGNSELGPLLGVPSVFIFVLIVQFGIVKHRLFDVRLIVARSIAYLLSLGTIAAIYSLVIFGISDQIVGSSSTAIQQSFYVMVAIALAVTYQPLKRFFDRRTNNIFYRDAYETKDLLDEFNQTIVSTIEIENLLDRSAKVIEKYIKPGFTAFGLLQGKGEIRLFNTDGTQLTDKLVDQIRSYVRASKKKAYITDALDEENADLRTLLRSEDIAALIRITKNVDDEGLGYILLGHKRSGSSYNNQDEGAMETVANELAIAIENALQYEQIQNFAKTLQNKVNEATRDLRDANEKLKKLDETKDDFISMASHQLRTPLTSVKGYVSMVLEGDAGKVSGKQKELLNQAFISSQRMVYLIADLLNVSRLRTGKFIIEPKPTNLADVVEGEISQLTETAKGRDLTLTYNKPKKFPELMLDETKIRQVIMNFSDNAIYYTPAGGHINVNVEDKGQSIEFTVVDDGIGVPKSEQHHLFNKFYRAGNAKKARPDGTGLGLFMAKKVVVAQGGSIIFRSQEGKGSTFGFSFTKKPLLPENYKGPTQETVKIEK